MKDAGEPEYRPIQGVAWYNILSNPKYIEQFAYLAPFISNRNLYIKDGGDDESNNFFQSDVVLIMMQLCAIPDDVV